MIPCFAKSDHYPRELGKRCAQPLLVGGEGGVSVEGGLKYL